MNRYKSKTVQIAFTTLALTALFSGCDQSTEPAKMTAINVAEPKSTEVAKVYQREEEVKTPEDALKLLKEGNVRYVSEAVLLDDLSSKKRAALVKDNQHPFAVVLTCSDSRVSPEHIFDQGLGDLFVLRNAGNVVDPVVTGSIEYSVEHLKAPLIVVMGHEQCGAVKATIDGGEAPGSLGPITEKIRPAYERCMPMAVDAETVYRKTIEENVRLTVEEIKKSPIVKELEEKGKAKVVGAMYNMDKGIVEYFGE